VNGGKYGYLTNWRSEFALTSEYCPNVTAPAVPAGAEGQFCWRPSSNVNYVELRVNTATVFSVDYDCGGGSFQAALFDSAAQTYVINTTCTADGEISVKFNGGIAFASNWINNNTCPAICYVGTSNSYFVGVVMEATTINATISQPVSVCNYPGPLTMTSTSAFSFSSPSDLKGLDYCLTATPANTTITYYQGSTKYSFVGDFRSPSIQCIA